MQINTATRRIMFTEAHAAAKSVHVVGESYATTFGLALRDRYVALKARLSRVAEVGREGTVDANWIYKNNVRGGGAVFPSVLIHSDYSAVGKLPSLREDLSRSRASGTISWQLRADRLYTLHGVSVTSSRGETRYLSTFDGKTTVIRDHAAFEKERRRRFPTGAELADVKEAQRKAQEEIHQRRQIELEKAKLAEIEKRKAALAIEAEKIETEGQTSVDGLPLLKGTPKQVAWAIRIRTAVQAREPKNPSLKRGTTAKFWIDNYRTALPRF